MLSTVAHVGLRSFLSPLAHDEILFWKSSLPAFNDRLITFSTRANRVVFSDASSTEYGGFHNMVEVGPDIADGQWLQYEASLSSTWRELTEVAAVLNSFAPKLAGHRVRWFTDNQNVVCIVKTGKAISAGHGFVHLRDMLAAEHLAGYRMDSSQSE